MMGENEKGVIVQLREENERKKEKGKEKNEEGKMEIQI
jgi:hypothetical protein